MTDQRYAPKTRDGRIAKVVEECGEVLQTIGKIGRHGLRAWDPHTGKGYDNQDDLLREMQDLRDAMHELEQDLAGRRPGQ